MLIPKLMCKAEGWRTALIAGFDTSEGEIVIGNIHLEWFAKDSYKISQLKRVVEAIKQAFPNQDLPIILAGGYNFSSFFSGNGLNEFAARNRFSMIKKQDTHRFFGIPHQVDYMLSKNCKIENVRTQNPGLSDHRPIIFKVSS